MNPNKKYIGEIFLVILILVIFIILCKKNLEKFNIVKSYNDDSLQIKDYVGEKCPDYLIDNLKPIFIMHKDITGKHYVLEYINKYFSELKELSKLRTIDIKSYLHCFYLRSYIKENENNSFELYTPKKEYIGNVLLNQVCYDSSKTVGKGSEGCAGTQAMYLIKDKNSGEYLGVNNFGQNKYSYFSDGKDKTENDKKFYFKCFYCKPKQDITFTDIADETYLQGYQCIKEEPLVYNT